MSVFPSGVTRVSVRVLSKHREERERERERERAELARLSQAVKHAKNEEGVEGRKRTMESWSSLIIM